jgi:hypothetical protein
MGCGPTPSDRVAGAAGFRDEDADVEIAYFEETVRDADGVVVEETTEGEREDMSSRDNISRVALYVQIRSASGGTCAVNQGTVWEVVDDWEPDDKHMVALLDSEENINGRCLQLNIDPVVISSAGSVTTHTYCYVDDQLDF